VWKEVGWSLNGGVTLYILVDEIWFLGGKVARKSRLEEGSEDRIRRSVFSGGVESTYELVKPFGVGVTLEVRLHGFDLDLLRSDGEDGFWDV
jgi:hypothetical protein